MPCRSQRKLNQARPAPTANPAPQSRRAGAVASIALSKTPQNFLDAAEKTQPAQDERKDEAGVQPVIEKVADQPAENDRADKGERQFDRQSRARGVLLDLLLIRRQRLVLAGWIQFFALHIRKTTKRE